MRLALQAKKCAVAHDMSHNQSGVIISFKIKAKKNSSEKKMWAMLRVKPWALPTILSQSNFILALILGLCWFHVHYGAKLWALEHENILCASTHFGPKGQPHMKPRLKPGLNNHHKPAP